MPLLRAKTIYGAVAGVPSEQCPETTTIFRGVPFARPPVGELRYHEPVGPEPWAGELACDKYPASPVQESWTQSLPNRHEMGKPVEKAKSPHRGRQSEDCLYMNIFTPAKAAGEKLPVMFWMYGGGFNYGSIMRDDEEPAFRGEAMNKRGVILVAVNYRVSIMGFMCHPVLTKRDGRCGNAGLLDTIAALRWVRENITAFGGDPDNVTIFGQSAGGVLCRMLMQSPLAKGLFRRAIIQSACGMNEPEPYRDPEWIGEWTKITLDSLGLTADDLLRKDATELAKVMPKRAYQLYTGLEDPRHPLKPAIFTPCLDGYSLTQVPGLALYAGDYDQSIDIMIGTVTGDELQPIKHCFQLIEKDADVLRAIAYSPSVALGRRLIETGRKPIYAYFWERNVPGGKPGTNAKPYPFHASELDYEFGMVDDKKYTEYDHWLSEQVVSYWTNFAKTGDPNGKGLPKWPAFTKKTPVNMQFRDDGMSAVNLADNPQAERVIRYCTAYPGAIENVKPYILPTKKTYNI